MTINNFKNFVGLCLLTGSLAFGFWGCSDSGSSEKETLPCFEYGDDETQITGYGNSKGNACSLEVVIPDGVTHIAEDAFKDKGITSVTFPESVEDIGANAFAGNTFSSHVYIPNESATFPNAFDSSVTVIQEGTDDCFEISSNALSDYYCMAQEVTIPNGVTSIEEGVFENKGLTSVTLPSALESIGNDAFKDNSLDLIIIPDTVTSIGSNAFQNNALTSVTLPSVLESIGNNAFKDNDLEDLTIPDTVTAIGNHAFAGNSRLTDAIQILDIDAEIANDAFPNGWFREVEGSVVPDLASLCDSATISQTGCQGETTITGDSSTEYDVVEIGNQCWFAENLHEVPSNFSTKPTWANNTYNGWYGYYGEDNSTFTDETTQGYLYQWAAAMNDTSCLADVDCGASRTQGACPEGWHVPSDCEFMALEAELGMSESDQVKSSFTDYRTSDSSNVGTQLKSNGTSGFNVTPLGHRDYAGNYVSQSSISQAGHPYWTSDTFTDSVINIFVRIFRSNKTGVLRIHQQRSHAFYVRCLKD